MSDFGKMPALRFAAVAALAAALSVPTRISAQAGADGSAARALSDSKAGKTIPMFVYQVPTPNGIYSGVIVGSDGTAPVTIHAVVIPLIVGISDDAGNTWTFDPTAGDSCDGGHSAINRFRNSPLVVSSRLAFNGVSVGDFQYIPGFKRATFWNFGGSALDDTIKWTFGPARAALFLGSGSGLVVGSAADCTLRGFAGADLLHNQIKDLIIPELQADGVISPAQFVLFITRNVLQSKDSPPTATGGTTAGAHGAFGSPAQTFAWARYDTASKYVSGPSTVHRDIHTLSHEIGEWMMDPLANNPTPPWGGIGEIPAGTCSSGHLEVGDPLSTTNVPEIKMNGYEYHIQELAFFSWFFQVPGNTSFGTGGKFSSNGAFSGPHIPCPPGGTY